MTVQERTGSGQARHESTHTFFVATDGDDRWSGKLAEPNSKGTDGPFATLGRARDAVRELKARDALMNPVSILARGGKYFLTETLVLGAEDSGSRACPITYAAYPGERPVLSGGRRITGWRPYRDKILRCELPEAKGGTWKSRQLFFDGARQMRARWPKCDLANPIYGGWALMEGPAEEDSTIAFRYKPGTFRQEWAKPTEAEVHYFARYGVSSTVPIKKMDREERVITLIHGGWQFDVAPSFTTFPFLPDRRFYVANVLEELDEPGQWCFDSEEGILYFWPPTDSLEDAEVVVPALDCLIDICAASWVVVSGFTFTETSDGDNFHHEGVEGCSVMYARAGWKYCGDAIHLKDAERCHIENNLFDAVGGNAVYLEGRNSRNVIRHNKIRYAGANGVCLLGNALQHPIFNEVSDNHIHHCGVLNKYTAGVFAGVSNGNLISHNLFEHLPHHAICLGDNPYGRNIVEYNRIRFACQETSDNGGINMWMEQPATEEAQRCGHIIRCNHISDCYGCEVIDGKVGRSKTDPSSGVYLDNLASNCVVYGNIIVRCAYAGVYVHGGKNNLIENNIFVDCLVNVLFGDGILTWPSWKHMGLFPVGNRVVRNICCQTEARGWLFQLSAATDADATIEAWAERVVGASDYNLFWRPSDGEYPLWLHIMPDYDPTKTTALAQWNMMGFDENSETADPLFVDPDAEDYRLRPASPALALGFAPIRVEEIGPRRYRVSR